MRIDDAASVMTEDERETLQEEIRLDSFFKWVWRGKWFIILLVVLASSVATRMGFQQPEIHDFAFKLESELDEEKASNLSPSSTERSPLIEKVVPGAAVSPDVWRGAAIAGLLGAIAGVAVACVLGYYYTPARRDRL